MTAADMHKMTIDCGEQDIVNLLPEPALLVTAGGIILFANRSCRSVGFSRSSEQLCGRSLFDLVENEQAQLLGYLRMCSRNRQMILGSIIINQDGKHIRYRCEGAVLRPNNTTSKTIILLRLQKRDQTQKFLRLNNRIDALTHEVKLRVHVEKQRKAMVRRLKEKNTELESFTYTASHDLKAPLITIKGFLSFLKEDLASGASQAAAGDIAEISNAADKMHQLLTDLLKLSRVGQAKAVHEEVSVSVLLRQSLEMLKGLILKKGVKIVTADNFPSIFCNRVRMQEVFQNLIHNAIKFSVCQDPIVEIGTRISESDTVFFVRDNGIGIDSDYHQKIFRLFEQLDPSFQGTGIGLAITKRIIEVHQGKVWVESDGVNSGSTFCFTVPLRPAPNKNCT